MSKRKDKKKKKKKKERTKLTYVSPTDKVGRKLFITVIEKMTGQPRLERLYNEILGEQPTPDTIWRIMVEKLELKLNYNKKGLVKIPQSGPLIFIANHPFGVVDGVVLGDLVSKQRKDFKFLVNAVLCRDETLNHFFLPIDFCLLYTSDAAEELRC